MSYGVLQARNVCHTKKQFPRCCYQGADWKRCFNKVSLVKVSIGNLHVRLTFNLGKTNKIFHYSYKEHPKISRIAKFGGEML